VFIIPETYLDTIAIVFKMAESREACMLSHALMIIRKDVVARWSNLSMDSNDFSVQRDEDCEEYWCVLLSWLYTDGINTESEWSKHLLISQRGSGGEVRTKNCVQFKNDWTYEQQKFKTYRMLYWAMWFVEAISNIVVQTDTIFLN
jgi:hypothetical protein